MDASAKKTCLIIGGVSCLAILFFLTISVFLLGLLMIRNRQILPMIPVETPVVVPRTKAANLKEARANMERHRQELVSAVLESLNSPLTFEDTQLRQALIDTKETSIPELISAMRDNTSHDVEKRIVAGMILLQLGYKEGFEIIKECLESESNSSRQFVLDQIGNEWADEIEIRDDEVAALLLQQLEYPDMDIRESAVWACHIMEIEGREFAFKQLYLTAPDKIKIKVLEAFAEEGRDPEALEWLGEEILAPSLWIECEGRWPALASGDLREFLDSKDKALSSRAWDLLKQYMMIYKSGAPGAHIGRGLDLLAIAEHGDKELVDLLKKGVREETEYTWLNSRYFLGIARIEGSSATSFLRDCIHDPKIGSNALEALGEAAAGSKDENLINEMIQAASRAEEFPYFNLAKGLLRIGGDQAMNKVKNLMPYLQSDERLEILRVTEGRTLESELREMVRLGLLREIPDQTIMDKVNADRPNLAKAKLLCQINVVLDECGVLVDIDLDAYETPPPYNLLLREIAEKSGGLFKPDWIDMEYSFAGQSGGEIYGLTSIGENYFDDYESPSNEPAGIETEVLYESQGVLYRFRPKDMGSWYDVDSITNSINKTLEKEGHQERFISLEISKENKALLFGKPETLKKVVEHLRIEGNHE